MQITRTAASAGAGAGAGAGDDTGASRGSSSSSSSSSSYRRAYTAANGRRVTRPRSRLTREQKRMVGESREEALRRLQITTSSSSSSSSSSSRFSYSSDSSGGESFSYELPVQVAAPAAASALTSTATPAPVLVAAPVVPPPLIPRDGDLKGGIWFTSARLPPYSAAPSLAAQVNTPPTIAWRSPKTQDWHYGYCHLPAARRRSGRIGIVQTRYAFR